MCAENRHVPGAEDSGEDLLNKQLDYAWKWFGYHARQRVSMSNFFLVASGLLATAYVNTLCKGTDLRAVTIAISTLGTLIALVFVLLDCRNAKLVYLGEDILRRLEKEWLFAEFKGLNEKLEGVCRKGIVYRDAKEPCCWMKHKYLLPLAEILVVMSFFAGGLYAFFRCSQL